jgi:hypothetical protein
MPEFLPFEDWKPGILGTSRNSNDVLRFEQIATTKPASRIGLWLAGSG